MDMQDPSKIIISSGIAELLNDVAAEANQLRSLGDFPDEVKAEIATTFLPERISDTLNIEGIRVNPRITRAILEGQSISDSDRYNEREIMNVIVANEFIQVQAASNLAVSAPLVREIHTYITKGLLPHPGAFRTENVEITGASFTPPHWGDVPSLIDQVCVTSMQFLDGSSDLDSIIGACWLHATFARIHPFKDGNGRVGRLLQDFTLIKAGLLPVGIPASRRQEYYDALALADEGSWDDLISIVADAELTILDRTKRIAEAPARRREAIRTLLKGPRSAARQREYNKYELWRRRMDSIRDEFQRWAEELNNETDIFEVRIKVWDGISFDKWSHIREHGWASGTWLFTLTFFVDRRRVYACIFFARRHEFNECLDSGEGLFKAVGALVTGHLEGERPEFFSFTDPYIRLREIVHNDSGELIVFRDPVASDTKLGANGGVSIQLVDNGKWIPEFNPLVSDVVEEFLRDMIDKLGLAN